MSITKLKQNDTLTRMVGEYVVTLSHAGVSIRKVRTRLELGPVGLDALYTRAAMAQMGLKAPVRGQRRVSRGLLATQARSSV